MSEKRLKWIIGILVFLLLVRQRYKPFAELAGEVAVGI